MTCAYIKINDETVKIKGLPELDKNILIEHKESINLLRIPSDDDVDIDTVNPEDIINTDIDIHTVNPEDIINTDTNIYNYLKLNIDRYVLL